MTVLGKGPLIPMGTMVMAAPLTLEKVTRCPVSLILTCSYTPLKQKFYFIQYKLYNPRLDKIHVSTVIVACSQHGHGD
jgi:hypothetical protein